MTICTCIYKHRHFCDQMKTKVQVLLVSTPEQKHTDVTCAFVERQHFSQRDVGVVEFLTLCRLLQHAGVHRVTQNLPTLTQRQHILPERVNQARVARHQVKVGGLKRHGAQRHDVHAYSVRTQPADDHNELFHLFL